MSNPKILIIDDDEGIRTQLKWALEDFEVIAADSRLQALSQFDLHHPPLITLDLGLPPDAEGTTEGFAILKEIMHKAPDTKVIVVSGSDEVSSAEIAKENGAFEYYAKPIEIKCLQQLLKNAYIDYKANLSE